MRSAQRSRYEFALAAAVRQLRIAEIILCDTQQHRAAGELSLIKAYLESEVKSSLAGHRPFTTSFSLTSVDASSRTASGRNTASGTPSQRRRSKRPAYNQEELPGSAQ